jgi:hypothetical protein
VSLTVLGYHLLVEVTTIGLPEPMGLWETTYASLARVFPHEYQPGNFVLGHDNYGPGYPAFCRPFLALIADPYAAHRVANLVALALAAAVLAWLLRQNRAPAAVAAGVVALFFALNAGSYSLQARPDFLVLFLIAAVFAVGQGALRGHLSPWSALLGAAALAAYLTKPYSLFVGALALALWGNRRGRRGQRGDFAAYLRPSMRTSPTRARTSAGSRTRAAISCCWPAASSSPSRPAAPAGCGGDARRGAPQSPDLDLRYWGTITALAVLALGGGLGWQDLTYYFHLPGPGPRQPRPFPCPIIKFVPLEAHRRPEGMERYALDEPGLIGAGVAGQAAAAAEVRAFAAAQAELLAREPPAALYLDFVSAPNPHGPPDELVFSTRNALPWFSADFLSGLTAVRYFHLRPYYGATNERRQDAGTWETLIIKFVPKRKASAAPH